MSKTPPLLRYPGSKHQLAPWIVSFIPRQHDSYREGFGGSASVLLNKPRSPLEAYNDLNGDLVNFMTQLRDNTEVLVHKIKWTPWSTAEYELSQQPAADPLEAARRFYFLCWASIRPFDGSNSFRRQKVRSRGRNGQSAPMTAAARTFMRTDHLFEIGERLRGVAIERLDALEFVRLYDDKEAVQYVDPPYVNKERLNKHGDAYAVEMKSDSSHAELAEVLNAAESMIILSGYACDLYKELYEEKGWHRVDRIARIDGGGSAVESLWLNPHLFQRLQQEKRFVPRPKKVPQNQIALI